MKAGLWMLTGLALLLWTAGMAAVAQLAQWLAAQLPQWMGTVPSVTQWPWPTWLGPWVDPALLQALQSFLIWLAQLLRPLAPSLQALGTVLAAIVWLLWGLGLVLLLGLALAAHLLIRRRQRRRPDPV